MLAHKICVDSKELSRDFSFSLSWSNQVISYVNMNWTEKTKGHVYFLNAVKILSYRTCFSGEQPCGLFKGVFFPLYFTGSCAGASVVVVHFSLPQRNPLLIFSPLLKVHILSSYFFIRLSLLILMLHFLLACFGSSERSDRNAGLSILPRCFRLSIWNKR